MNSNSKTVAELLKETQLQLPGSDLLKTFAFLIVCLLSLALVTVPWCEVDFRPIQSYQRWSTILLIASLLFATLSAIHVCLALQTVLEAKLNLGTLFLGKVLMNLAVVLFFSVVCMWVLVLGGILSSPFAALLSMSPVLLSIQVFTEEWSSYERVAEVLSPYKETTAHPCRYLPTTPKAQKNCVFILSLLPILLVLLTLSAGQVAVSLASLHEWLLDYPTSDQKQGIFASDWYLSMFYFSYYLSVLIAIGGVMPRAWTRRYSLRWFI